MTYDPLYLHQAMCVQIANSVLKNHNIEIYSVRASRRQDVEHMVTTMKLVFQYEKAGRMVTSSLDLYGPNEDFFDVDSIAAKIADKVHQSSNNC